MRWGPDSLSGMIKRIKVGQDEDMYTCVKRSSLGHMAEGTVVMVLNKG